jgi:hypothetical protein
MTKINLRITGKDLKEINQILLEIADSVALEYESYLQYPEEKIEQWEDNYQVIDVDNITGKKKYGYIIDPKVPEEKWKYTLHSGQYKSENGKGICDRGIKK